MANEKKARDRRHRSGGPAPRPPVLPGDKPCYRCAVCEQPMTLPGGYCGTGLCGVCATGEADMMEEIGETW